MTNSIKIFLAALILFIVPDGCNPNQKSAIENSLGQDEIIDAYEKLLSYIDYGRPLFYSDNLTGRIVWNERDLMESLLNVYQITQDKRYLDIFVQHADHVLSQRDDLANRTDSSGESRPGWQSGAYYTLGVPAIIPDIAGQPSLEVQAIRRGGNNHTVVEIQPAGENRFDLIVKNDFRRKEAFVARYENLTLSTIEAAVNAKLNPESYLRVRVLGNRPPAAGVYALSETYRVVFHELHTPAIGIPFLRFAALVFESQLLEEFEGRAKRYVAAFEESYRDYINSWREDEEGGYFIFEANEKQWAAGLPVPYNGLSANGRFLLWLYRTTGKQEYLEKAAKLARKIQKGMRLLPDGTITMSYWYGLPYQGWGSEGTAPVHELYVESKPDRAVEDISHFTLTLDFMLDAYYMGLVFQDKQLQAVAETFSKKIWKPGGTLSQEKDWGQGIFLAHTLEGRGRSDDYAAGTFALLAPWSSEILGKALEVYCARFLEPSNINLDYEYGPVLLGWSKIILASHSSRYPYEVKEQVIYPFTPHASVAEYLTGRLWLLDEEGILVTDYKSLHGGAGKRYNAMFIAQYASVLYRDYLKNNDASLKEAFFKQVKWLRQHRVERSCRGISFWVWEYDFDNPTFGAKAPWVSALAQGRILYAFLAAYGLTHEIEYLHAAEYAFRSFLVPTQNGGVTTFEDGIAWYEEVADEEAPSSKILNGHIGALAGLWILWRWTGRQDVKRYLDLGIAAVKRDLDRYDAGFLSYYSQYPENPRLFAPARDYNTLHVHQLLWLYSIAEEPLFLHYALRFARYDEPGWSITTAGSTDPKGHGPENLYLEMYSKYWSHNEFPTWVQIDLGSVQEVTGVTLLGYLAKATPKDYRILSSITGEKWNLVRERWNNTQQYPTETFNEIVSTRFIKIEILSDNGNNNVALTGIGVHRLSGNPVAISDWESFRSGRRPTLAFTTGWPLPIKGWWLVDLVKPEPEALVLKFSGAKVIKLSLLGSDDLRSFTPLPLQKGDCAEVCYLLKDIPYRYLKVQIEEGSDRGFLHLHRGDETK